MFFTYQFHNNQKLYQGKDVSCLDTAESHFKHNTYSVITTTKLLPDKV